MIPNHVLVLGGAGSGKLRVAQWIDEQGAKVFSRLQVANDSHSGLIVRTTVSTKYYKCELNLLVDEFPEVRSDEDASDAEQLAAFDQWIEEFAGEECTDVREAIQGVMLCVDIGRDLTHYINGALERIDKVRNLLGEAFLCVIGTDRKDPSTAKSEEVEDMVISYGIEYVDWNQTGFNEFSERIGKSRVEEILHTHEWSQKKLVHDYAKSKQDRAKEMSQGLLDEFKSNEDEEDKEDDKSEDQQGKKMDLEDIFQKLQLAKDNVNNLSAEQREAYVNKVIEEVIDFI